MKPEYSIADTSEIITPALVVFRELMEQNLAEMIRIARGPVRLRPHCKTHKMSAVVCRELELGITKHKVATFAEVSRSITSPLICLVSMEFLAFWHR